NVCVLVRACGGVCGFAGGGNIGGGMALALAIACKITPALFLPYFAWKRAWKTLSASAVGLVLFFGVVPGCRYGMEQNAVYLRAWFEHMVLPYVRGEIWSEHENQSLPGLAYRLLTESPSFSTRGDGFKTDIECHNLL